jgi:hypothetical protein
MNGTTYTADGVLTDFDIGFALIDNTHLRVLDNNTLKTLGTDYNIIDGLVGKVNNPTKKIRFAAAPTNGHTIAIYRNLPIASMTAKNPEVSLVEARSAYQQSADRLSDYVEKNFWFGQTALLAPTAISFTAPFDGYFESFEAEVIKVITTGGTITAAIAGSAVTGAVVTVANSAIVGNRQAGTPSVAHASYTKFRKGQLITLTPASFATAGDVRGTVKMQPADF